MSEPFDLSQGLQAFSDKQHQTFYSIYNQTHQFFDRHLMRAILALIRYYKKLDFEYYKSLNQDLPNIEPLQTFIFGGTHFRYEVSRIIEWQKDIENVLQLGPQCKSDFFMERVFSILYRLFQETHIHKTILEQHYYIVPMIHAAIIGSNIQFDTIESFNQMIKQFFVICWKTYLEEFKNKNQTPRSNDAKE